MQRHHWGENGHTQLAEINGLANCDFFLLQEIRQIFLLMKNLPVRLLNSCHHPINCEMSDFSQNMCERLGNYFSPHMIVSTTMDPSYFFQSVLFFHCQTIKVWKYVCSKCIQFSKNILLFILGKILHYFGQTFLNLKQMAMHNIRKKGLISAICTIKRGPSNLSSWENLLPLCLYLVPMTFYKDWVCKRNLKSGFLQLSCHIISLEIGCSSPVFHDVSNDI